MLIGIDWGRGSNTILLLKDSGKIVNVFKIENNYEGYLKLLECLRVETGEVVFAIENYNLRLVDFLIAHGYSGFYVNPNAMPSYRSRYKSAPVKDDELDAYILADLLRADRNNLVEIILDNPLVRELKGLIIDRGHCVKDETRLINRLQGCLTEYYPEALRFFKDPASKVALDFWEVYPTLEDARRLTVEEIKEFLAAHKWYKDSDKIAEQIIKIVNGQTVKVIDDLVRVKARLLLTTVKQLKLLKGYDCEIKRLVENNEETLRYTSLPGAGALLGGGVHTVFDGAIKFNGLVEIRAYVGTAPITSQSGQFKGVSFRFACNKFYRNIFHQLAFCSLKESQWAKEYYRRKRREGKDHHHALRCLADLWVKVAYAMWRNREPYDENKHLASMARFWMANNHQEA